MIPGFRSGFAAFCAFIDGIAGNQLFHDGVPVQLLYRVAHSKGRETWRVRPLFIEAPDREDRFTPSGKISFLHTMSAPGWTRAA